MALAFIEVLEETTDEKMKQKPADDENHHVFFTKSL